MFSGSVDAGFVVALPFYHGDLEPDCVGVSTELHNKVTIGLAKFSFPVRLGRGFRVTFKTGY